MWYVSVLDSTSRFQSGILTGNNIDLGNFDECLETSHSQNSILRTQYCLLKYITDFEHLNEELFEYYNLNMQFKEKIIKNITLGFAICMPEECSKDDMSNALEYAFEQKNLTLPTINIECTKETNEIYSTSDIVSMYVLFKCISITN